MNGTDETVEVGVAEPSLNALSPLGEPAKLLTRDESSWSSCASGSGVGVVGNLWPAAKA